MSIEQQSLLEGVEPYDFSEESTAPEGLSDPADLTGVSSSTTGNTSLNRGQEPRKGDYLSVSEEDSDESDPPVLTPSREDVAHEYPISSWAMLSPDMTPEQERPTG